MQMYNKAMIEKMEKINQQENTKIIDRTWCEIFFWKKKQKQCTDIFE